MPYLVTTFLMCSNYTFPRSKVDFKKDFKFALGFFLKR